MKKEKILLLFIGVMSLQSCFYFNGNADDVTIQDDFQNYSPVIMQRTEFEASTSYEPPRTIINSGKIYVKDQFLFVNEVNQGFHVFNNSNPENPVNIGFLKVLGSSDLAIKNDVIYVNNAVDLIAISPDFGTETVEITKRIENTFPQIWTPDGFQHSNLQEGDIIVDWTLNN